MSVASRWHRYVAASRDWADDHPTAVAVVAWYLVALPGLVTFLVWFWGKATCTDPWIGLWFWRVFGHRAFDTLGPIAAMGCVSVLLLRTVSPLGARVVGGPRPSIVALCLVVYLASLLFGIVLTMHGQLVLMLVGSNCP